MIRNRRTGTEIRRNVEKWDGGLGREGQEQWLKNRWIRIGKDVKER
jgi:hypothetical protein